MCVGGGGEGRGDFTDGEVVRIISRFTKAAQLFFFFFFWRRTPGECF